MNLSDKKQETIIVQDQFMHKTRSSELIFGTVPDELPELQMKQIKFELEPYGIRVWKIQ